MNRKSHRNEEPIENDQVWKLLGQVPPAEPTSRFSSDTVRLARLAGQPEPWWKRLIAPVPIASFAAATAAIAITFSYLTGPEATTSPSISYDSPQAETIQEIAETEMLIAASDNLQEFSDAELVRLIGL